MEHRCGGSSADFDRRPSETNRPDRTLESIREVQCHPRDPRSIPTGQGLLATRRSDVPMPVAVSPELVAWRWLEGRVADNCGTLIDTESQFQLTCSLPNRRENRLSLALDHAQRSESTLLGRPQGSAHRRADRRFRRNPAWRARSADPTWIGNVSAPTHAAGKADPAKIAPRRDRRSPCGDTDRPGAGYTGGMLWKRILLTIVLLGAAVLAWRIAVRGDRLEQRMLRTGGGIVQTAAQRPARTLTGFAILLGGVWLGVAGFSWLQRRSDRTRSDISPRGISPQTDSADHDVA